MRHLYSIHCVLGRVVEGMGGDREVFSYMVNSGARKWHTNAIRLECLWENTSSSYNLKKYSAVERKRPLLPLLSSMDVRTHQI